MRLYLVIITIWCHRCVSNRSNFVHCLTGLCKDVSQLDSHLVTVSSTAGGLGSETQSGRIWGVVSHPPVYIVSCLLKQWWMIPLRISRCLISTTPNDSLNYLGREKNGRNVVMLLLYHKEVSSVFQNMNSKLIVLITLNHMKITDLRFSHVACNSVSQLVGFWICLFLKGHRHAISIAFL